MIICDIFGRVCCALKLHKWNKWQHNTRRVVHREQITLDIKKDIEIWRYQERYCKRCNFYERREVD